MKKILSTLVIASLMLSMMLFAPLIHAEGAVIWTDKPDYTPGETAIISGSGFLSNAAVTITITRPDSTVSTISALTDGSGAFSCSYQLDGITGTYTVAATDGTNTATTTFTDRTWSVSVSPTSATVLEGGSTTATVTVTASPSGGPEVDLWATGQPTGVTVSFSPTKGTPYFTSTMSISVALTTTSGTYPIDIMVFTGKPGQPSYSEKARTTFTLTITGIPPTTVSITITSSPVTGYVFVKVDGTNYATPTPFDWTIGSTHTLEALSPVAGPTGTQFVWITWSDGGAQTHDYTVPSSSATVTANYKTQYLVSFTQTGSAVEPTVDYTAADTDPTGTVPFDVWVKAGSAISYTYQAIVPGDIGIQYVLTGVSSASPQTVNSPLTIIGTYKTQYYLTVVSDHGTPSGEDWYDECTYAYAGLDTGMVEEDGTRYLFVEWTFDATGTDYAQSDAIHMDGAKTAIAEWETQYYLTVVSPYDTPGGMGWYDAGATAHATLATGTVDIVPGSVRAVFTGWSSDASGTGLTSDPIHMDGPKTAVTTWKIQYYLTVVTDPSGLVSIPGEDWYDNYTWVRLTAPQYVPDEAGLNGVRYRFSYWDVDGTSEGVGVNPIDVHMDAPHTATAHYVVQYKITFDQSGVGSDFAGTVVTIDGSNYGVSGLPVSFWWDDTSPHNFAFQSPLVVPPGAKQYDWASTSGLSSLQSGSITVTGPGSITGNYVTRVHDVAVTNLVAIIRHCKWGNGTWVFQGRPINFNVTVENNGDFDEALTVTLYYNITANEIIGTQNITLLIGESKTLSFVWNTASVPYCHNYTITAVATIPADYTPADNTLDNVYIKVRIMGDLDGDGKVDMKDIRESARSFASYGPDYLYPGSPPHPRWNLDCDINEDNLVDMKDLREVARNFGMCAQ
jgi:hypothetical protein